MHQINNDDDDNNPVEIVHNIRDILKLPETQHFILCRRNPNENNPRTMYLPELGENAIRERKVINCGSNLCLDLNIKGKLLKLQAPVPKRSGFWFPVNLREERDEKYPETSPETDESSFIF